MSQIYRKDMNWQSCFLTICGLNFVLLTDGSFQYFSVSAFQISAFAFQITSAKVRSILRKYQMPLKQRAEVRRTDS